MAAKTTYLLYSIHLTDKAAYEAALLTTKQTLNPDLTPGPKVVYEAPDTMEAVYSAPKVMPTSTAPGAPPGGYFDPPCMTSAFWGTSANNPTNVKEFKKKSGGWFGISWLFGDEMTYVWTGVFEYAGADGGEVPGSNPQLAMPVRTWVEGFENGQGTAPTGNAFARYGPNASRHPGGHGFAARNGDSYSCTHRHTESGHAATDRGWERLYVRLRHVPNTTAVFWQMIGNTSPGHGARLAFTPSGQIAAINNGATAATVFSTEALVLDRWYKLDILYRYGVAPNGFFRLFIGGVKKGGFTAADLPNNDGIGFAQNHNGSTVSDGPAACRGAWDFDDWVGGELPRAPGNIEAAVGQPDIYTARDWNSGSKVVPLVPNAPGTMVGWAGPGGANANDWRFLSQRPISSTLALGISNAGASPVISLGNDGERAIDFDPQNRGMAACQMTAGSQRNAATGLADATVSFTPGGSGTLTINESSNWETRGRLLNAGGTMEPVSPMKDSVMGFTGNSAAASAKTVFNLVAQVECIGMFYTEDYVPQAGDPPGMADSAPRHWINDLHQWAFGDGPWGKYGGAPSSIVVNHCGQYVGNGTTQLLTFRTPPAWIFIRNTATNEGYTWLVSSMGGRRTFHESTRPSMMPRVYLDPNFAPALEDDQSVQSIVVIAGNNAGNNLNGVIYNYFCFQDAGQRFAEAGALWEQTAATPDARDTRLNQASFTPEFALLAREQSGSSSTSGTFFKGLGLPANQLNQVNAAAVAQGLAWSAGKLTLPALNTIGQTAMMGISFLALRRDDGSEDPGIKNVMQLASWTGDGVASRTVSLAPPTGRRPMWAIVSGSNGTTRVRDALHTGTNSLNAQGEAVDASQGILGGAVDAISVGSLLNTLNVQYEAWVVPGCSNELGNAGWGVNCESIPVGPTPSPPGPGPGPTVPPGPETPGGPGGPPGGTAWPTPTGTITQCPGPSTLVINQALQRIGISKQLTAATLNTEVSPEATTARLSFDEDVRQCLRDYPWPFATRYEKLTLVAGPAHEQKLVQGHSSTAVYIPGSVVRVAGVDYYCIVANTGQPVGNTAYWSLEPVEEANGDWVYAYRAPVLSLFNRRIVNNDAKTRRTWDMDPPDFRVGSDDNLQGALIYTDVVNAELEFTVLSPCVAYQGDALFRSALAWRHAHSIAGPLTRDKAIVENCWNMYQRLLRDARGSGAQETQQPPQGDPDWITGRN